MTTSPSGSSPQFGGNERFDILRHLGAGGMGVVYEALDRRRNERVALKLLSNFEPFLIYQFKQEFRSLAEIAHPNLLPLYELFAEEEHLFFTMELLESPQDLLTYIGVHAAPGHATRGDTALQFTQTLAVAEQIEAETHSLESSVALPVPPFRRPRRDLDWDRLRAAFAQLCHGVNALHSMNMVHRDLKPENVLVRRDGRVLILDFGLIASLRQRQQQVAAAGAENPESTRSYPMGEGRIAGTVRYMAPEQAAAKPVTAASDWYSVGVMLFEALTGTLPFNGLPVRILKDKTRCEPPAPGELAGGIPEDLNALCVRLLRLDPLARPSGPEILAFFDPDHAAHPRDPTLAELPAESLFVGRTGQLAVLYQALGQAVAGRASICHVYGPSGSGKSALVQRFIAEVGAHGDILVLGGRCREQESVPFKAVDGLIDALGVYLLQHPSRLSGWVPEDLAALTRVFPVLSGPFASQAALVANNAAPAGLRDLHARAMTAFGNLLVRISRAQTLILSLDDVQWGDLDSVALLEHALRQPAFQRILIVASYRSGYRDSSPFLRSFDELGRDSSLGRTLVRVDIEVPPLSVEETRELALQLLGPERQSPDTATLIVRQSGGSAYFIYELARYIRSGMEMNAGGIELDEILWQRVMKLPDAARAVLEAIAIAGVPVRIGEACAVASVEAAPHHIIASLRAGHFVRTFGLAMDDEVEPYHDRVRESVAGHVPPERRKHYHARLAESLEAAGRAEPETIAAHLRAAENPRAAHFYELAAGRALDRLAFNRADGYFRHAAELYRDPADLARVYEKMIHFYTDVARFQDAYETGCRAVALFGTKLPEKFRPPALIASAIKAGLRVWRIGIEGILDLPETSDEGARVVVRLISAVAKAAYQVDPKLCVTISAMAVNLCLERGNIAEAAVSYMVFGCIFLGGVVGQYRQGHRFGRLVLRLLELYGNVKQRAEVHFVVGYFATSWIEPATEAERLWSIAYEAGIETNDLFHTGCACGGTIQSLFMRGVPLNQVWDESERMLGVLRRADLREPVGCLTGIRQQIREMRGEHDAAFDRAAFEAELAKFGSRHFAHFYFINRMQALYLSGGIEEARAMATRSAAYQKDSAGMLHSAEHVFYEGLIAAAANDRRTLARSRKQFQKWSAHCAHNFEHKGRLLEAEHARLRGRSADALRLYGSAAASAERFGYWPVRAIAYRLAASLNGSRKDSAGAALAAEIDSWRRWGATALAEKLPQRTDSK